MALSLNCRILDPLWYLLENRMLKIFNEPANQYSSPQNQLKDQLHVKKAGGITYTCCNLRPVLMFLFVVGTRSTYLKVIYRISANSFRP